MAKLFEKQANLSFPALPLHPFEHTVSPSRLGRRHRQRPAAQSNVIGTDTSEKQLEFKVKLPKMADLEQAVAPAGTVDIVTVAQALHWFDLPIFYRQVKLVLKKPHGVIAGWCYHLPRVTYNVDKVFDELYEVKLRPYWDPRLAMWEDNYESIEFPFEPVDGANCTGPIEFVMEKEMDLEAYLMYVKSVRRTRRRRRKERRFRGRIILKD